MITCSFLSFAGHQNILSEKGKKIETTFLNSGARALKVSRQRIAHKALHDR